MGKYEDLNSKLNEYLKLNTFIVAVKLLESENELKDIVYLKKPEEKFALCQIFSYARY